MKPPIDQYFMSIAKSVAVRSNCISRKVGALIVCDRRIISAGYNGTPRGILDCDRGGCARCNNSAAVSGVGLDKCWCNHAEENAIVNAAYYGISTRHGTLYSTLVPCLQCVKMMINAGVAEVVYCGAYAVDGRELLEKAAIKVTVI